MRGRRSQEKRTARSVEEPPAVVEMGTMSVGVAAREGAACKSGYAMRGERGAGAAMEAVAEPPKL